MYSIVSHPGLGSDPPYRVGSGKGVTRKARNHLPEPGNDGMTETTLDEKRCIHGRADGGR